MRDEYIRGKSPEDLLGDLYGTAQVGSAAHDQIKTAAIVRSAAGIERSADELRVSIDRAADSSDALQRRLSWLTAAIAAATVVGAFAAAWQAFVG